MLTKPLRLAIICTGNICRSPMAEVLLKHLVSEDALLQNHVEVTSAGIARWHLGSEMDPRARRALHRAGLFSPGSLGSYADSACLDRQDLVVVMTRDQLREVGVRLTSADVTLLLWRNLFESSSNLDVADPYYGHDEDFDECLVTLRQSGRGLTALLRQRWEIRTLDQVAH